MAKEKTEIIEIKTANGHVKITRTSTHAVIEEERTCYGFKEKSRTEITKLDSSCMHHVFFTKPELIKSYQHN